MEKALPRIIYVEDDDLVGQVAKDILTMAGHQLDVVANGLCGLENISTAPPDLVILDLNLPGMNGFEVLLHLRRNIGTLLTPILILTIRREPGFIDEVMRAGADSFMTKPFTPFELIDRVESMIGS